MIKKVKRKNINLEKYSTCLSQASNYRIYAEAWYLDALTNKQWDCLVYGDYEVIMPIPYQRKLGIKLVIMPIYCQQLGVFYSQEITDDLFKQFEKKLHRMLVRSYCFNEENTEKYNPRGELRVNHILDLNKPYEEIYKDYRKDRKKDIRRFENLNYTITETNEFFEFFELLQENHHKVYNFVNNKAAKTLLKTLRDKGLVKQFQVLNSQNNNLITHRIFIISKNRIFILASARNKKINTRAAAPYLINQIIIKNSNKNILLDFEGSSVKGIANFNESFGAKKHYYISYKNFL